MHVRRILCVIALAALPAVAVAQTSQPTSRPAAERTDPNPAAEGFDAEGSDAMAIELADAVMEKLGGRAAWDDTRFLSWRFFGQRFHVWDKKTGNTRVESANRDGQPTVILMNLNTKQGRAWVDGVEVTDETALAELIIGGLNAWINDAYWVFMPYKLKDSGVTLNHLGERAMEDGRPADVLQLTFKEVGSTPRNKYHVYVARETGLVEQWDFYRDADDPEPGFKIPWKNWRKYGEILLSDDRGEMRGRAIKHTDVAVFDELPESVFTDPAAVDLKSIEGGHWGEKTG